RPVFPDARFELYQAIDFRKAQDGIGISIFLYRVAANATRRNIPPRRSQDGKRYRAPLPLDLHFVLTAWAPNTLRPDETLELVFDPLSLQGLNCLLEVMEPKIQPLATYVVGRVDIESAVELPLGDLVQTRVFGVGDLVTESATRG